MASLASAAAPRERLVTLADGTAFTFVEVPAGRFIMGSPAGEAGRAADEGPQREVTISRSFWLGKHEVTQAQWAAVMKANPAMFRDFPASARHPVDGVSWFDAQTYLERLNALGLGRFRLPTEAEWEYAARAGSAGRFPWGDDPAFRDLPRHAWYYPRSVGRSHPVGLKEPNPWGLHDMFGGVWEWCADWFGPYAAGSALDPRGPTEGKERCIRGGSWFNEPEALRSANRHRHPPDSRQTNLGLRLVWEPAVGPYEAVFQRRPNGSLPEGYRAMPPASAGPWFVPAPAFVAPHAGESPRLLFRRSDLSALRAKAETPEGRAILARLRFLLDGRAGEGPPAALSTATRAYPVGPPVELPPGTLTIGHTAGHGLLYQITGDKRHAELGRECIDHFIAGVRDRDPRYSFRRPGGALRAGPTLGWLAVGYDLCRDGWDAAARERIGRALWEYAEVPDEERPRGPITLESLARGTMPPHSNHFGMQTGGAALALLALEGEPWLDRTRHRELLELAAHAMQRNLEEGFGDGGYFTEGDGTGSMASQIVFLSALQAWRKAVGRDYFAAPRPHARMLTLKWVYQTVFREGQPDLWPVRGGYAKNVWARGGLSGAGYFAFGLGALPEPERAALRWCYGTFLAESDARAGTPFDTASLYPHVAVSAFVNWPLEAGAADPNRLLPHAYRDSETGFFCWRERWRDGDDTVITVLTNPVRGYMGAPADAALAVHSRGRRLQWGKVAEGPVRHWWMSARGELSSLTLADGTALAVDFSGASGAGVMLVTTGPAEGRTVRINGKELTFWFPTADASPAPVAGQPVPRVEDAFVIVGRQRVSLH
ncbi:MAG: formylglycine-generating enzyme family protein, partial [Opitutaceae bacterium]